MKRNTKNSIRDIAIGTSIAAVVGATYALKDNPKIKKIAKAVKKEVTREVKKMENVSKTAYKKIAKQVKKNLKKTKKS